MKKVLALVLAVMMMATVAFAAEIGVGSSTNPSGNRNPGSKIKLQDSGNELVFAANYGTAVSGTVEYKDATNKLAKKINTENYTITGLKYNEGKSLIESVKINDADEQVVIQLKSDYTNVSDKKIDVEFTLKGKGKFTNDAGKKVSTPNVDVRITGTVGYQKVYLVITENDEDVDAYDLKAAASDSSNISGVDEDNIDKYVIEVEDKGGAYATMTQEICDGDVTLEVRVYDGNKFNLATNTDVNKDVVKANPDAELTFYKWEAAPTFDATAKVFFNEADEDSYVYQIKDGRLTEAGSYSDDDGCWVLKTRTLGAYVVSDVKLANATAAADPAVNNNPDTGANDVVGIATALAAVALVSAAAVSLKK